MNLFSTILFCLMMTPLILCIDEWESFKKVQGKSYKSLEEEKYRRGIWSKNQALIDEHNAGNHGFKMKANILSDLTEDEIQKQRLGFKIDTRNLVPSVQTKATTTTIPSSLDYRTQGIITRVKDQGYCGSCWAFAAVALLEAYYSRKTKTQITLSEQQLIDCSTGIAPYYNHGCNYGDPTKSLLYAKNNRGLNSDTVYPYKGTQGTCKSSKTGLYAPVFNYTTITPAGNETLLMQKLVQNGPIIVGVSVTNKFNYYYSGIFYDPKCSSSKKSINHVALLVGYGSTNGSDFWIIKNSWGTWWGEKGYIRLARNKNNHCGVATYPTFAVLS